MLHTELKEAIEKAFDGALAEPVTLFQDAMVVRLANKASIEIRVANADEYSMAWHWMGATLRIDTAPMHRELATFPNHLHDASGALKADPLTHPGLEPWKNVHAVISTVMEDPLLGTVTQ
ncbi:MAG: hypothetical protein JO002_05170 [Burkholderiaceae bacterium]|nr:hypothetical protein [Burkholderiaceae bacterium]